MEWFTSRKRARFMEDTAASGGSGSYGSSSSTTNPSGTATTKNSLDREVEFLLQPAQLALIDTELKDVARFIVALDEMEAIAGAPDLPPLQQPHKPFNFSRMPVGSFAFGEAVRAGASSDAGSLPGQHRSSPAAALPPAYTRLRRLYHLAEGVTHEHPAVQAALETHDALFTAKRKAEQPWEWDLFEEGEDRPDAEVPQAMDDAGDGIGSRKPLVIDDAYYEKMVFQHRLKREFRAEAAADPALARAHLNASLAPFLDSLDACTRAQARPLADFEASERGRLAKRRSAALAPDASGKGGKKGSGDGSGLVPGASSQGGQAAKVVLSPRVLERVKAVEDAIESGLAELKAKHMLQQKSSQVRNQALIKVAKRVRMSIVKRDIIKAQRAFVSSFANAQANAKKAAVECQKEVKRIYTKEYQRTQREAPRKAKKMLAEMMLFWKKNDKEEKEKRKAEEKELSERRKMEEEMREAKRQQRKFNFLITQTELYAHFMHNKGADSTQQNEILSKISAIPQQAASASGHDGDESDEVLRQRALDFAQQAREQHMARTAEFDQERRQRVSNAQKSGASSQDAFDGAFSLANPNLQNTPEIVQPTMLRGKLKPYQLKGLRWLANLYQQGINGILADEMGLGKTVQSISTLAYLAEVENIWGPFLIVTPTSTLHNWAEEVAKFVPDLKILPYWGSQEDRKTLRKFWDPRKLYTKNAEFHVMITSYEMVVQDAKHFSRIQWQYMILDEAQAIKSSSSNRWNILLKFNCRNRLLLTGTPIQNSMAELWALLHFIMPSLFDSHTEFNEWFSKDIESHAQDKATKLDFNQLSRLHMILKPFMLRRIKRDVENELGEKIEIQINCHLTPRQQRFYNGLKKKISIEELINTATSNKGQADHLMNLVMQFRKVCNHPELFQRRPFTSPFVMCALDDSEEITGPAEPLPIVTHKCASLIPLPLPRIVYWDILRCDPDAGSLGHTHATSLAHGVLSPAHIHSSLELVDLSPQQQAQEQEPLMCPASDCFSFTRFSGVSIGEAAETLSAPMLQRWLLALLAEAHADQHARSPFADHPVPQHRMFDICPGGHPERLRTPDALREELWDATAGAAEYEAALLELDFVLPGALAPPIQPSVSSRAAVITLNALATGAGRDLGSSVLLRARDVLRQAPRGVLAAQATGLVAGEGVLGLAMPRHGWTFVRKPSIMTMITDSCKMQVLDTMLVDLKRQGHRVLIYSQMTRMLNILEEYLAFRGYKYFRLDGSCEVSDRRDMVADFQSREDVFVFLLSTRAGGVGINLTAADTVIFYDSDWNPTVDQQAMDRAHRLGQTRQVTVYRLIAKGTVEERILQRAEEKSRVQKMVITGEVVGSGKDKLGKLGSKEVASLLMDGEVEAKLRQKRNERRETKRKARDIEKKKLAEDKEKREEEKRLKREQLAQQKAEEKARRQAERKNRPAKAKKKPAAKKGAAAAAAGAAAASADAASELASRTSTPANALGGGSSSNGGAWGGVDGDEGGDGDGAAEMVAMAVDGEANVALAAPSAAAGGKKAAAAAAGGAGAKKGKKRAVGEDGENAGAGESGDPSANGNGKPKKAAKKGPAKKDTSQPQQQGPSSTDGTVAAATAMEGVEASPPKLSLVIKLKPGGGGGGNVAV